MMKKFKNILRTILGAAMLLPLGGFAQQASMTVVGLSGQNITVTGSTLYIPAGGYLNATGNIFVATNQLVADSNNTIITGTTGSRLQLFGANQLDGTAPAAATLVDVNGAAFNVDVTTHNPQNVQLTDQAFGAVVTNTRANAIFNKEFAFGITNPFTAAAITDNHVITNSNLFIVGAAGSLTGFDAGKYVVTNNNAGELRKLGLTTGQNFFYPIGRAEADYTPARMQVSSGGAVDYYMNVRNFAESAPDENIGGYATMPNVSRTWTIYGSNANTVANMDFIHPGTPTYEVNGYDRNNSNVIRFTGGSWAPNTPNDAENESLFGTPANYFAQQITFAVPNAVGSNSYYGKSNSLIVLPIKLEKFTAVADECTAVLNWSTSFEQNSSHFIVERSYSGRSNTWEYVSRVNAAGNSSTILNYNITDAKATAPAAYYRLVLVDLNGNINYSPARTVLFNCGKSKMISVYPNPVHDYVNVLLPQGTEQYTIKVFNVDGKTVLPVVTKASNLTVLQTGILPTGVYIITVIDAAGKSTSTKIIKN